GQSKDERAAAAGTATRVVVKPAGRETYQGDGLRTSTTAKPIGGSENNQSFVWNQSSSIPVLLMDSGNAYIYGRGHAPIEQVDLATGTNEYLVSNASAPCAASSARPAPSPARPPTTPGATRRRPRIPLLPDTPMNHEIQLISDGDGLAVIGDSTAVE